MTSAIRAAGRARPRAGSPLQPNSERGEARRSAAHTARAGQDSRLKTTPVAEQGGHASTLTRGTPRVTTAMSRVASAHECVMRVEPCGQYTYVRDVSRAV